MTQQEQIKALAELDGYSWSQSDSDSEWCWRNNKAHWVGTIPSYLTSYDAIIPLIQKQPLVVRIHFAELVNNPNLRIGMTWQECHLQSLMLQPQQLCEALLRATNKWKD